MVGQTVSEKEWLIVVNPNAGHEKGKKDWYKISGLLDRYGIKYVSRFTVMRRHAIDLTIEGIREGFRKIIAVGGDGTMNEVVNGVFNQTICPTTHINLGMITVGTGNDWGKMFSIPTDYEEAVKIIAAGKSRLQDSGIVTYYHGINRESRYFINIAGLGFDAVVTRRTNLQKDKGHKGKTIYFLNLLRSLLFYRHTVTSIAIDGKIIQGDVFTISIGIGRFSGGGMMQTPNAIPDDGLFDITVIRKIGKGDVIMSLKMLYDGTILDHPKISGYKGKEVLIDSDPLIHLEADGESLGHSPIEFRIIPKSVNIIYGSFPV
ncbi:MAG TPA: diacylglycerol kinase family protein [Bacteroidales bacterium]|jgi:YegS/Rv2252/BmrU family lipid kinase|nr:diacylglycerol kinase family protein [Bacteroidales bacterium]